jgi:hypothetical protein
MAAAARIYAQFNQREIACAAGLNGLSALTLVHQQQRFCVISSSAAALYTTAAAATAFTFALA